MFFPYGDDNVKGGYKPIFSYAFILFNVLAFLYQISFEDALICEYGSIPSEIVQGQDLHTLFTSMFMHGGVMHLVGNMVFLWIFADNIEATVGNIAFVIFYLLGGLAASAAHIYLGAGGTEALADCCMPCAQAGMTCAQQEGAILCPGSVPTVGASGAISAVMGAYLVMFPKSRIKIFVFLIIIMKTFRIPAFVFLLFWIGQQLASGLGILGPVSVGGSGVAWWAHIGGFFFGVFCGFFARGLVKDDPFPPEDPNPEDVAPDYGTDGGGYV